MDIRLEQINRWLQDELMIQDYTIAPASADASFRRYFRILFDRKSWIIMDAPPEKEDCSAFIEITERLLQADLNAPKIIAYSRKQGFLMLSDLGNVMYLDKLKEKSEHNYSDQLYKAAIDSLVTMQSQVDSNGLPKYDDILLLQEMSLFHDWLLTQLLGVCVEGDWLEQTFDFLQQAALQQTQVFVHRDYHSRNLTWQPDQAPGILDFQDAVIGPISYDLVSLLRDCYIQWPQDQVVKWIKYYTDTIRQKGLLSDISDAEFIRSFDLMGVQRHLKASGIFARLSLRDGKQGYLKDIPLTLNYIVQISENYHELQKLGCFIKEQILPKLSN